MIHGKELSDARVGLGGDIADGGSDAVAGASGIVETPECRRDLAVAGELIHAVRLRENSVRPGDFVGLCRLLRQNLQDMARAREQMARRMTGHELGENVGQMDASLHDIRYVIGKHCTGR